MVIVIWAGGMQAIRGDLTVGQIVAFTNYLLTTMGPLIMMTMLSNVWATGIASAQRVNEVLDTVPEVQDAPGAIALPGGCAGRVSSSRTCPSTTTATAANRRVLDGINLTRRAGQDGRHPGRNRRGQDRRWST